VVYLVRKEPGAEPQRVPRSKLRHGVVEKQCHPGITDDKKHGSYTMRYFIEKTIRHLKGEVEGSTGVVGAHGLTTLPTHSDNAAQHFRGSKSPHFFTKQLPGIPGGLGFTSITWDFGAPGHG
jgi:hypothetical protein